MSDILRLLWALCFLDQGDKSFSFYGQFMFSSFCVFLWFPIYFLDVAVSVVLWVRLSLLGFLYT